MDTQRIRALLDKREAIDRELLEAVNGNEPKKTIRCSACGEDGHTARTCGKKSTPAQPAYENGTV